MCGFAGFTTFSPSGYDPASVIRAMTQAVAHRGPDGEGFHQDPNISLGHRRLAIIDQPGGAQPMPGSTGRYQLIYNGEVYNYPTLRSQLEAQGHQFRSRSDTEVILELLISEGPPALEKFNGMFALALWDREQRQLLLARDRIGIKPLYYSVIGPEIIFASELKALLKHPLIARTIDPASVSKYFSFGYIPAPHSIFSGIHKLEPGACLTFGTRGAEKKTYWDIPLRDNPVSGHTFDESCDELHSLMRTAVRRQLQSDVPVGVFLSGGIDSSAIALLASQESPAPLHSFSIGFDDPSYDESSHAAQVAKLCGTIHHQEILTLSKASSIFREVTQSIDEPLGDASLIPTYLLARLASSHVKVVLGGDGSDELFAGYPSFQAHRLVQYLSFLPSGLRDHLGRVARRLPVSHHYTSTGHLLRQFINGLGMSPEIRFLLWMGCYGNQEKTSLFSHEFNQTLTHSDAFEDVFNLVETSRLTDTSQRLQYLCMKTYFQDDILVKVDRAGMAHSLEVRVPFMDSDLVDFACRLQPFYKLNGFVSKYILKHSLQGKLPHSIIHRRKAGFMMPVAAWLAGPMREEIEDLCSPSVLADSGFFNPASVRQMLDEHFTRRRDHRKRLFPLLSFMAWLRNFRS